MGTDELIEALIDLGVKAYKKNSKGCTEWNKLNRHESVIIDGYTFNYWREYGTYKAAIYIKELAPECSIEVDLKGNDSGIRLCVTDEEQKEINRKLYLFLKERGQI